MVNENDNFTNPIKSKDKTLIFISQFLLPCFRIVHLCEKWEKVLSHGIRTNLSNSAIQSLVTAGLNFTFNIINVGKVHLFSKSTVVTYFG